MQNNPNTVSVSRGTMKEKFNALFEEYSLAIEKLLTDQIIPVFDDHQKLVDYVEKNKEQWSSLQVEALEKSLIECYKKLHALQSAYRVFLLLPFDQYLALTNYTAYLLKDMDKTSGLAVDPVVMAAAEGIYKNFPLHATGPDFKEADSAADYTLSINIRSKMEALRECSEFLKEGN